MQDRKAKGVSPGVAAFLAPACQAPPAPQAHLATLGFQVPRERASGASLAHLDLRDPPASATRGARALPAPQAPLAPQGPLHFPALTGRLSAFLALRAPLGPLGPLEPWAPPQG